MNIYNPSSYRPCFTQEMDESYGTFLVRSEGYRNTEIYHPRLQYRGSSSSEESIRTVVRNVAPSQEKMNSLHPIVVNNRGREFNTVMPDIYVNHKNVKNNIDYTPQQSQSISDLKISKCEQSAHDVTKKNKSSLFLCGITKIFQSCKNTERK